MSYHHRCLRYSTHYDVSPDGQQFIIAQPVGDAPRPRSASSKTGSPSSATASRTNGLSSQKQTT